MSHREFLCDAVRSKSSSRFHFTRALVKCASYTRIVRLYMNASLGEAHTIICVYLPQPLELAGPIKHWAFRQSN